MTVFTEFDISWNQDHYFDYGLGHTILTLIESIDRQCEFVRVKESEFPSKPYRWFKRSPLSHKQYFEIAEPPTPHVNLESQ